MEIHGNQFGQIQNADVIVNNGTADTSRIGELVALARQLKIAVDAGHVDRAVGQRVEQAIEAAIEHQDDPQTAVGFLDKAKELVVFAPLLESITKVIAAVAGG